MVIFPTDMSVPRAERVKEYNLDYFFLNSKDKIQLYFLF